MKTKYFVNEAKRTVVCVLDLGWEDQLSGTITDIAKCSPADEFDETKGKIITNTRAHIEYHNQMIAFRKRQIAKITRRLKEEEERLAYNEAARKGLKAKLAKVLSE